VPETLAISNQYELSGWLADYYEETPGPMGGSWEKRGEEIFGRANTFNKGDKTESVLQYHRPLLEDGQISYEFYYEPGKAHTEPALDRLTCLLDPDGVQVHQTSDDRYDRSGLVGGNTTVEPANRRGPEKLPLKAKAWNRIDLILSGNKVTLKLNDVEIYQRELDAGNQRFFGLFHYADETEVRVRNVTYSGKWPRQLPAASELFA